MVKADLKAMLDDFFVGKTDISRLNHGMISLIPKEKNADRIQNFWPICLLNISYKILTKILAARLARVIDNMILSTQTAFLKGRFIMEGVVTLHETLHGLHRKKK